MSGLAFLPTATPAFRPTIAVHIPAAALLACRCCEGLQSGVWGADDEGGVTQSGVMSPSERVNRDVITYVQGQCPGRPC